MKNVLLCALACSIVSGLIFAGFYISWKLLAPGKIPFCGVGSDSIPELVKDLENDIRTPEVISDSKNNTKRHHMHSFYKINA